MAGFRWEGRVQCWCQPKTRRKTALATKRISWEEGPVELQWESVGDGVDRLEAQKRWGTFAQSEQKFATSGICCRP